MKPDGSGNERHEAMKKVSIIIPTLNETEYLPGCLKSIANLEYPKDKIEVIVVDNGSTDNTREIAAGFKAAVLRSDSMNVSGLRNLGVAHCSGEIIAFVDADCIVARDWLIKASVYFNDMEIAAWGSPPSVPENATWVQRSWYLMRKKENKVQDIDWLESMNLFARKEQFQSAGGFNERLVTCEDVDLSYRLKKSGRLVSDRSIQVVHLGEAATVKEFIRKEIWRGHSNLKGVLSHGIVAKELPSLIIPLYFGILLPCLLLLSLILKNHRLFFISIILFVLPSAAVLYRKRKREMNAGDLLRLFFLIQIYFIARTVAVVRKT